MLSTSHTLACPECGQQATFTLHTKRHQKNTKRDGFEPQASFSCRNRCTLAADVVRGLCAPDAMTV